MANCPNCGSNDIQLKRETNVSWGRAIVGYALFGVVGGAVGGITGEDRNVNACLDCGTTWRAADLYNSLQFIKRETGKSLDLTRENHRLFLNEVIAELSSYSNQIAEIENKTRISIQSRNEGQAGGGCGCLIGFLIAVIISIIIQGNFWPLVIIICTFASIVGRVIEGMGAGEKNLNDRNNLETFKQNKEESFKNIINRLKAKYSI